MLSSREVRALAGRVRARCVAKFGDELLQNRCNEAADALELALRRAGRPDAHFVLGVFRGDRDTIIRHCWVEIRNRRGVRIVDIAASQFNKRLPAVWYPADPRRYISMIVRLGRRD